MRRFWFVMSLFLLALPFGVFAQQGLPPVNPATVSGDILIAGSPVLSPIVNNLVTQFSLEGYPDTITVETNGTDSAMQQLCSGTVDIVLADRQISPQEAGACTAAGRPSISFRLATSAVIVAVSRQNDFATSVSSAELQQIFGTALSWSDVRPDFPSDPIGRFGSGTTSNEFQLFAQVVFNGNTTALSTAVGAQYNDDPNVTLQSIAASPNAIGFFEANFALLNETLLSGVIVDGVEPSFDNIINTLYPLSRPLLVYTTSSTFSEKPQVADFLNYMITNAQTEANALGLFPAPPNALAAAESQWLAASGQVQTTPTVAVVSTQIIPPTATPIVVEAQPTNTPIPDVPTTLFPADVQALLVEARLDLETLANDAIGSERPVGWSGSLDINNPQLPLLVRLDLELLAATFYGLEERPDDWFGAVSSTQTAIVRDIRHDIEIMADDVYDEISRPIEWAGGDAIYSCDRSTQALVTLLGNNGLYTLTADPFSPDYCRQVALEVSRFVEVNLINPDIEFNDEGVTVPSAATIETTIAVGFFSTNARQRAGVVPFGTGITPIARSYLGFSNMTLIEGEGFLVFVEWQNTSLTQEQWRMLPNEADIEYETNCSAIWCETQ